MENYTVDFTQNRRELEENNYKKKTSKTEKEENRLVTEFIENEEDEEDNQNDDFDIEDFLNPKLGSKNWLEEQPEKIRVLIEERKYDEAVHLLTTIRTSDLSNADYDTKLEIDSVYNFMIEKLTVNISVILFFLYLWLI